MISAKVNSGGCDARQTLMARRLQGDKQVDGSKSKPNGR